MFAERHDRQRRVLAKLLRELQKTEQHDTLADLADALKYRCARLRIPWTPEAISAAIRLIETNTSLVRGARCP